MSLNKKTKSQLAEIAEELAIDITDCKVKNDILEAVKAHLLANANDYNENSKYYETVQVLKLAQPKPVTVSEEDEDEDEEEEENVEGENPEDSEDSSESDDDDYDDDDDIEFVFHTTLSEAISERNLGQYFEYKSLEIRDYLSDPFSINDVALAIETFFLLSSLAKFSPLESHLPTSINSYVPSSVGQLPILDYSTFTLSSASTVLIWIIASYVIPNLGSYYLNFTYDFQRDAFTYSLTKLFVAIVVFKAAIPSNLLVMEAKYTLANLFSSASIFQTINHGVFIGLANLRETFDNWIIIEAIFTSILAFYANLSFI